MTRAPCSRSRSNVLRFRFWASVCSMAVFIACFVDRPHDPSDSFGSEADSMGDTRSEVSEGSCAPNQTTCIRGVVAMCDSSGSGWKYSPCPPGQVCERDDCVPNTPTVVLVATPPIDDQEVPNLPAVSEELRASIEHSLCSEIPDCCATVRTASTRPGNEAAQLATKYWLRRILSDLAERGTFSVSLLSAPSRLDPPLDVACVPPESVSSCLEGSPDLMTFEEWQSAPLDPLPTTPDEHALSLLRASIRVADEEPAAILEWVDGVYEQDSRGQVINPELNTRQTGPYDLASIAWLYLTTAHRPEGRSCESRADCGHRHYQCVNAHCSDPAAACRTQDVVVLGSFLHSLQFTSVEGPCYTGGAAGLDWDVWVRWLRWGATCDTTNQCRPGSTCADPCSFSDYPECRLPNTCLSASFMDNYENSPWLASGLLDLTPFVPTAFPLDSAGRELEATFHSIFTGMAANEPVTVAEAVQYASRVALLGGGVAVTPGPPEISGQVHTLDLDWPYISFDFETRYIELVEALFARQGTTVCTPEKAGLKESSP